MPPISQLALASWVLAPVFAVADRAVGSGHRSFGFLFALAASAGVAALNGLWPLALFALVWGLYRSLPFKGPLGSIAPNGVGVVFTFLRHLLPALVAAALAWRKLIPPTDWVVMTGYLGLYATFATILAVAYACIVAGLREQARPESGQNAVIELLRGALYGAALAAWATF